uniref:Small fragment nuclease n=1 Tax=Cyprinus carpio TaxID=7962 RepID=A0A8C1WQ03_CYPCA
MLSAACVSAFRVLTRVCVASQRVKAPPLVFTAHNFSLFSPCASVLVKGLMSRRHHGRKMSQSLAQRMVWVDLEMTGLDIEKDRIIEMACIVTDSDLNIIAEGPNLIINQPDELLDGMSDWCKEHHGKSESQTFQSWCVSSSTGNSVHADKKFLDKFMPQFMRHLHYRIIDVSTIKELSRRWYPEEYSLAPQKKASHRALEDIQESIKELKFYRANVFKVKEKRKIVENGDKKSVS